MPTDALAQFWSRHVRRQAQFLLDFIVLVLAFVLAYSLRFDFEIPARHRVNLLAQLPLVVLVQFVILQALGIYRFLWRYVSLSEVRRFVLAAGVSLVILLGTRFLLPSTVPSWRVPISVGLLDTLLAFGGIVSLRILRRAIYERLERPRAGSRPLPGSSPRRVILAGAGRAGSMVVRELGRQRMEVVGFVDDDPNKRGRSLHGHPILGTTQDLPVIFREYRVQELVVTMTRPPRPLLRALVETARSYDVDVRIIPSLHEIIQGRVEATRFRHLRIEDLLGREPAQLDEASIRRTIAGRSILVSGAGGSIGAELARQIARFEPSELLLVERAEGGLFEVHRELVRLRPDGKTEPLLADVRDERRMREIFMAKRPQVVVHAAAHKHVALMEAHPVQALENNALATFRLGTLAGEAGVEKFVLISTDKAVRPASVMGASKRIAEILTQELNRRYETRFTAVRFGNVLGSNGSVVPIFREQIERGGPIEVTHPDVERYFMTISEAAQLVLQSASFGEGGEIFILDMGQPVKILDLAKDMARLAGLEPGEDIEIVLTGLRAGEKLREELRYANESVTTTAHPKVSCNNVPSRHPEKVAELLKELEEVCAHGDAEAARRFLRRSLPEMREETGEQVVSHSRAR